MTTSIHPAFDHPDLDIALDEWCEATGTDRDTVAGDEEFIAVSATLASAGLLDFRTAEGHDGRISPTAYANAARRAALVLLGGVELAHLRRTPIPQATERAAGVVAQLGTPTGYEGEPDLLAKHIHNGTLLEKM